MKYLVLLLPLTFLSSFCFAENEKVSATCEMYTTKYNPYQDPVKVKSVVWDDIVIGIPYANGFQAPAPFNNIELWINSTIGGMYDMSSTPVFSTFFHIDDKPTGHSESVNFDLINIQPHSKLILSDSIYDKNLSMSLGYVCTFEFQATR